jgi:hypothetical protein
MLYIDRSKVQMPNLSCQAAHCLQVDLFQIEKKLTTFSEQQRQTLKETFRLPSNMCRQKEKPKGNLYKTREKLYLKP